MKLELTAEQWGVYQQNKQKAIDYFKSIGV